MFIKAFVISSLLISLWSCHKPSLGESSINKINEVTDSIFLSKEELNQYISEVPEISKIEKLQPPFDTLRFEKVIAYEFNFFSESVVDYKGEFIKIIEKQKGLNESQIIEFTNLVTSKSSYGGRTAACFTPKMSIVFFRGDKKVCIVDICLDCNYLESTVPIPVIQEARSKVSELGITYGFSEKGVSGIKKLSVELDFIYKNYEDVW